MKLILATASALALATVPASAAFAQPVLTQNISGTRLDLVVTGEVKRVPDIATISTGVVTLAPTATAAIAANARQMASVRQALRRAGIADRDIQTSSINLYPDYRQDERGTGVPQLIGYRASNDLSVRFRDIANTGKILDALVAQGANQINGPTLGIENSKEALNEARANAITEAGARAERYARLTGKKVGRIVSISESGGGQPVVYGRMAMQEMAADASSKIEPGEQIVAVTIAVTFELE